MRMSEHVGQVSSLCGGLSYYPKYLPTLAKHLNQITCLLKNNAIFKWTYKVSAVVRTLMDQLSNSSVLVFPAWDAALGGSRKFHLYCDASTDGLGATLEQEQRDGSIRPIAVLIVLRCPMNRIGWS